MGGHSAFPSSKVSGLCPPKFKVGQLSRAHSGRGKMESLIPRPLGLGACHDSFGLGAALQVNLPRFTVRMSEPLRQHAKSAGEAHRGSGDVRPGQR